MMSGAGDEVREDGERPGEVDVDDLQAFDPKEFVNALFGEK